MDEKNYEDIKREYEAATDAALVAWAQPYFSGEKKPDTKDVYIIGNVSNRAAADIKELTDSDVSGFKHVIRSDVVRHVQNRHGAHGKADQSMEDLNDLGRIAYVLQNYDEIITNEQPTFSFNDKRGKPANVLRFVKRVDGHVYTAEAVTDSPKKKTLYVLSMYKAKTTIKRELAITDQNDPDLHVQDETNSSSIIIPQNAEYVKTPSEKKRENFETYRDTQRDKSESIAAKCSPMQKKPTDKGGGK